MKNRYIEIDPKFKIKVFSLLLNSLLLAFPFNSFSQTEKGLWHIGGAISLSRSDGDNNLSVNPSCGYFINDHIVFGTGLSFYYSDSDYHNSSSTGFYPYGSYYFGQGKIQPFLLLAYNFSYSHHKWGLYNKEVTSGWSSGTTAQAGVSYFLNQNAAIEGVLSYNFKSNHIYISFGFQIYLGKRKE